MRLTSIQINNLAAFKDFKAELPAVALIGGKHGVGKSSIERVLMYGLGRRPLAAKGSKSFSTIRASCMGPRRKAPRSSHSTTVRSRASV